MTDGGDDMTNRKQYLANTDLAVEESLRREAKKAAIRHDIELRKLQQANDFDQYPDYWSQQDTIPLVNMTDALAYQIGTTGMSSHRVPDLNSLYKRLQEKCWGKKNKTFPIFYPNNEEKISMLTAAIRSFERAMERAGYVAKRPRRYNPTEHGQGHIVPGSTSFFHYKYFSPA